MPRKSSHAPNVVPRIPCMVSPHAAQKFLHYTRSPSCREGFSPSSRSCAFSYCIAIFLPVFATFCACFAVFCRPHSQTFRASFAVFLPARILFCKFPPRRSSPSMTSLVGFPRAAAAPHRQISSALFPIAPLAAHRNLSFSSRSRRHIRHFLSKQAKKVSFAIALA